MNVDGISNAKVYNTFAASDNRAKPIEKEATASDVAAIYEKSSETEPAKDTGTKTKYIPDPKLVEKMKADLEERTAQLKSLVEKIILKQAEKGSNIFDFLGSEYSAEDIAQAKEDVSEDGYWGVKQTSQRILDFAVALTGGDPDKIEQMRSAFEQGYKMAEEAWGGELPSICKDTYDAVFKGFDEMANQSGISE